MASNSSPGSPARPLESSVLRRKLAFSTPESTTLKMKPSSPLLLAGVSVMFSRAVEPVLATLMLIAFSRLPDRSPDRSSKIRSAPVFTLAHRPRCCVPASPPEFADGVVNSEMSTSAWSPAVMWNASCRSMPNKARPLSEKLPRSMFMVKLEPMLAMSSSKPFSAEFEKLLSSAVTVTTPPVRTKPSMPFPVPL